MITPIPIVVSGSIAIDRIMTFKGRFANYIQPEKIDVISVSVFLDHMANTYGGVGANIAYSLALLGETPYLLGSVGKDGATYMEQLESIGVNTKYVFESALPSASFNAFTDSDQNQISGFYPGAMFDSDSLSLLPWKDKKPVVLISPQDPKSMKSLINECKKWSLRYCYDIGQQVSNTAGDDMVEGIANAEMLILNEYELSVLSKKTGINIDTIKSTVPIVITTLAANGSIIEGKLVPKPIKVSAAKARNIVDPTGAGDAFRAGFIYGYIRLWPLKVCAELGSISSVFAIEHNGTQGHKFNLSEAAERYEENFKKPLPK